MRARARCAAWESVYVRGGVNICVGMHRRGYQVDAPGRNRLQLVARCAVQIIEIVTSAERLGVSIAATRSGDHLSAALKFHCVDFLIAILLRFASNTICQMDSHRFARPRRRLLKLWIVAAAFSSNLNLFTIGNSLATKDIYRFLGRLYNLI